MSSTNDGFYPYDPSLPAAIAFAVVFALFTIVMFALSVAKKTTFFYCMIIGMLVELTGLVARVYSVTHKEDMYSYLVWYLTVVLAPSFLAAAVYQTFGRLVWTVTPVDKLKFSVLFVPPRFITPLFVLFDLFAFLIQLLGVFTFAGAYTKNKNQIDQQQAKNGENILKIGLIVQLVCFGLFALIGVKFVISSRKWGTQIERKGKLLGSWHRLSWAINLSATLIMARAIYRIIEFSNATSTTSIYNQEWAYWVLDTLPLTLATGVFLIWHPGHYLPRENTHFTLNKKKLLHRRRLAENNEKMGPGGAAPPMYPDPEMAYQAPLRPYYTSSPPVGLGINDAGMRPTASRSPSPPGGRRTRPNLQVNTTARPNLGVPVNPNAQRFPVNPVGAPVGAGRNPYAGAQYNGDLGSFPQTNPRAFV